MKQLKMLMVLVTILASVGIASAETSTGTAAPATTTATGKTAALASLNVSAPRLVKKDETSITLEWDKVAAADTYLVQYDTGSIAKSKDPTAEYAFQEVASSTGITLSKLTPKATYYFSVIALDKSGHESEKYSDEIQVTLGAETVAATGSTSTGAASTLAVGPVTVVNDHEITVEFSAALAAAPTLKIEKSGNKAVVTASKIVLDPANAKVAKVTLASALDASSSYSLTVLSAKDTTGATIAEGAKAITEFPTTATLAKAAVTLNAASASGATASGATAATGSVTDSKALPATGTKENLIIALALLIALGIVGFIRKKKSA